MPSVMPFTFNAVKLCVVTINEKPWTRAKEACRALEYNKKTVDIVKAFCSRENYSQKYQMSSVTAAGKPVDWLKDSQKYDIRITEEGMYELLFSSRQPKAKDFRRQCYNVLFPHVRQQPIDKLHAMDIEDLTGRVQALQFTNEAHQQKIFRLNEEHQQPIEEKDAALVLLSDDLQNCKRDRKIEGINMDIFVSVDRIEKNFCQERTTNKDV